MDSIIIHTNMLFHIVMLHTLSLQCMSQDWLKWAKDHLIIILHLLHNSQSLHSGFLSYPIIGYEAG